MLGPPGRLSHDAARVGPRRRRRLVGRRVLVGEVMAKKPVVSFPWGDVYVPQTPNFILSEHASTPIHRFTDKALKMIAKRWSEELIRKAQERRKKPGWE